MSLCALLNTGKILKVISIFTRRVEIRQSYDLSRNVGSRVL